MGMNPRLLRPTASGFDPRRISGLQLWSDASVTSSLTFNGSTVSKFDDLSGNGRHFVQDIGGNQPTYGATLMNGRPGLQFADIAGNRMLSSATIADVFGNAASAPAATIFSVMRVVVGANSANFGSDVSDNGRFLFTLHFAGIANQDTLLDITGVTGGNRTQVNVPRANAEAAAIYRIRRGGGTQSIHRNSALQNSTSTTSAFPATTAKISIGTALGISGQGVFSELLFYNRVLSATEVSAVERYLAGKYGLTLA